MRPLDPILHQPTRLRIMAYLLKARIVSFVRLRDALKLTDGNLAGHVRKLETAGYVSSRRALRGIRFDVRVSLTAAGGTAMHDYAATLRDLLTEIEGGPPEGA